MSKLWSKGQPLDTLVENFTVGEDPVLDRRLLPHDVRASIAHAQMLESIGILSEDESRQLVDCLALIEGEFEAGRFTIERSDEDVHTAIERFLKHLDTPSVAQLKNHTQRGVGLGATQRIPSNARWRWGPSKEFMGGVIERCCCAEQAEELSPLPVPEGGVGGRHFPHQK